VDILCAIALNRPFVDVVNLPNTGQIENLPAGAVVETLGLVDRLGFRAVTAGALPGTIRQLVMPHCVVQQMTLEAALTGNLGLALEALCLDPCCAHLAPTEIRAMGRDLVRATRAWLPQFRGA
jgi:alpha-galactosidase/6-phospho-beta-glucosidase family protein